MNHQAPSLISLFTGAGGLDLGLEQAGFRTLVANEIERHACETLRQNQVLSRLSANEFDAWFTLQLGQRCYKGMSGKTAGELRSRLRCGIADRGFLKETKIVERDIRALSSNEVLGLAGEKRGGVALIAGGPPCQPFSRSGKREAVKTDTGKLFKDFVRLVDEVRPRWFLFENVKGLILTRAPVARLHCRRCGETMLLDFDDWELLQEEQSRVISCYHCAANNTSVSWENKPGGTLDIILQEFSNLGYRCYHKILNAADYGAPQQRERLIIVGSRDGEDFDWPLPTHGKNAGNEEPTLFGGAAVQPWLGIKDVLWPSRHWRYGTLRKDARLWVKNVVRPHDEPVTWTLDRPSPTIGAHQGAKLAIAPYGVPEAQLVRQQWHTLGRRQGDTPPVFVEHEYLTDLELLKLQTFPENWFLFGTRMQRVFQIGNAVPPILAYVVGRAILDAMGAADVNRKLQAKVG